MAPPHRRRPSHILAATHDDVHMQLADDITQCRHIHLVGVEGVLEHFSQSRGFPPQLLLVGDIQLSDHQEVLLISDGGTLVRTRAAEISQVGRNTQGVTLIRLSDGETLQAVERLDASLDEDDAGDGIVATGAAAPEAVDTPPEA